MFFRTATRYFGAEIKADFAVHVAGTLVGVIGASTLVVLAAASGNSTIIWSIVVYDAGLAAMLGFSAAYHVLRSSERRELLRRLDHAAIFVMIAGTYTPFTASAFDRADAAWLTATVWAAALTGVVMKLAYPRRFERASILIYLILGWAVVIFMRPLLGSLDRLTVVLLVLGGLVYSIGACIHCWRRLLFHDALWHSLVLMAAGLHYAAILYGVVLIGSERS
jgi:hemolysin III